MYTGHTLAVARVEARLAGLAVAGAGASSAGGVACPALAINQVKAVLAPVTTKPRRAACALVVTLHAVAAHQVVAFDTLNAVVNCRPALAALVVARLTKAVV